MGTPKTEPSADDFLAVSVAVLSRVIGPLTFDVYVRRSAQAYTKIFPKGEAVDALRLEEYHNGKGVELLYVSRTDYLKYQLLVDRLFAELRQITSDQTEEVIAERIRGALDVVILDLMANSKLDDKTILHSNLVVASCVEALRNKPPVLIRLMKFVAAYPYLMKHSMMTSLFAVILAKADGMNSSRSLEIVGMGGLLHDVGMSRISFDEEAKQDLSNDEWKELKTHPEQGKKLLDSIENVPGEVKLIVLQHHEQNNGGGYPNGMYGSAIFRPAKIVMVADVFSSLITKRPYRERFTPVEAISIMLGDQGKFDEELVLKLADVLGLKIQRKQKAA